MPSSTQSHYDTDTTDQVVHSADHIALRLPLAGPTSRMLAYAIDAAFIVTIEIVVGIVVLAGTPILHQLAQWLEPVLASLGRGEDAVQDALQGSAGIFVLLIVLLLILQFFAELVYFMLWDIFGGGRSLGKRLVKLQVVADGGLPLTWQESLVRNGLRIVDVLPTSYFVGLLAMLTLPDGKRLGDLAAGTIVIRLETPEAAPPLEETVDVDATAFRFDRAQLARIGEAEQALIRQTLRRVEELPSEVASTVLEQAVGALRQRLGYDEVAPQDRRAFLRALLASLRR